MLNVNQAPVTTMTNGGVELTFSDRATALKFVHQNWVNVGEWCHAQGWHSCQVKAKNWSGYFDLTLENHLRWKYGTLEGEFMCTKEKVMMNSLQKVLMPGVQFGAIAMTGELWDLLEQFKEDPDFKGGLVRQRDEAQLAMSLTSQDICSIPLEEAVQKKRRDYWHLPSLEQWKTERRDLTSDSWLEFTWYSNGFAGINREPQWKKITNQYRLLLDANGEKYELSRNVGMEYIAAPPLAL